MTEENQWETRREILIKLLSEKDATLELNSISRELKYSDKHTLVNDIHSVAKTLKNDGIKIEIIPAYCLKCGFKFKQTEFDFKIPSRCPRCKEERIEWPQVKIEKS